jgi:peroxiredoxin
VSHDAAAAEPFVRAALLDADPDIKELALRHARLQKMTNLMADVSALLDHPELTVNVAVAQTLRNWTGVDFGVRLSTLGLEGEGAEETEEGIGRWRAWRDENRADWQDLAPVAAAERSVPLLEAPDFELPTLKGEPVRLSQLRGRPVLINFWATWCSSCWPEIPELVALQNRAGERLTILGISLDGLPDQHAIDHGHSHHGHGEEGDPGDANAHGMSDLRKLVGGFAESKGMNYPVLLDPEGRVSMRYQGNELPVNVLIDAEGRVVRRFIGGRSANAFDDMILASLPDSKTSVAGPTP